MGICTLYFTLMMNQAWEDDTNPFLIIDADSKEDQWLTEEEQGVMD